MKILIDENLPLKVNYNFGDKFDVYSVKDMGWEGITNGNLLKLASNNDFEVMITLDKNLRNQQNLEKFGIKIILLKAQDNKPDTISNYIPRIVSELKSKSHKIFIEIN